MPQKLIQRFFLIFLIQCAAMLSALAQDNKALVGKWDMTSETGEDPVKWTLIIKETDGKLTGSLASEEGEMAANDFSYTDGVLKFKASHDGEDYAIELKLVAGKLDGTWSGGGNSGKTSGIKSTAP
jgi:hypothetical protein